MQSTISTLLKEHGLRDTQSRRLILAALLKSDKPLSQKEVYQHITSGDAATNLVTVYRVLQKFVDTGVAHIHPSSGKFVSCALHGQKGHHVLLSCQSCGIVEECCDANLCKHEDRIAQRAGFVPTLHLSELVGLCSSCH